MTIPITSENDIPASAHEYVILPSVERTCQNQELQRPGKKNVRRALGGGIAMRLYGGPWFTNDVDCQR